MTKLRFFAITVLSLILMALAGLTIGFANFFDAKYTGQMIEMRDGIKLATFVHKPDGEGPFPTLIFRTPYEIPIIPLGGMEHVDYTGVPDHKLGEVGWPEITDAGYAFVLQHSRGRVGSEGQTINLTDRNDGVDLVKWIQKQPWSNGLVGTMGDSAGANLSVLINAEQPAGLKASFIQVGTPNMINETILGPGGALKLESALPWIAEQGVTADDNHFKAIGLSGFKGLKTRAKAGFTTWNIVRAQENEPHNSKTWRHLPLTDFPNLSEAIPNWNELLKSGYHGEVSEYYDSTRTSGVPTYYVSMWDDVFATALLNTFERNEAKGLDQRLLIMNGTHYEIDEPSKWPIHPLLPWFDRHLKGKTESFSDMPRVIFSIGNEKDEWYGTNTWPPAVSNDETWHLTVKGGLIAKQIDQTTEGALSYNYDPDHPVPTVGGRNLLISHGSLDQSYVRAPNRSDVLSYQSEILKDDKLVAGHIFGNLTISSDRPDTDFTMKLLDAQPDGKALLVAEGIIRARYRNAPPKEEFMQPGKQYDVKIDLGHTAWRFKTGHRIAVDVSSSNFPQWDRNLNTDAPLYSSSDWEIAQNTVHHGPVVNSVIRLPIVENLSDLTVLKGFSTGD